MAKTALTSEEWQALLKGAVTSQETTRKRWNKVALVALEHYASHGDVVRLNDAYKAMDEKWGHRAAFGNWVLAFGGSLDFNIQKEIFFKVGKSDPRNAIPVQLEAASKIDYAEFRPAKDVAYLDEVAVIEKMDELCKKFLSDRARIEAGHEEGVHALGRNFMAFITQQRTRLYSDHPEMVGNTGNSSAAAA